MRTPAILRNLISDNPALVERSADLNSVAFVAAIAGFHPLARFVDSSDIEAAPAPAWYLPETRSIFIKADDCGYVIDPSKGVYALPGVDTYTARTNQQAATVLGLLAHEAGHAGISDQLTPIQTANPQHADLMTLIEEIRVENYALRSVPLVRPYLRASFALILGNLPAEFENKGHVVRAWTIARGRTLSGVAEPDETNAVDVAARTLLGDDTVDGLTDLLQEALTLRLMNKGAANRLVQICEEWKELVGEPAEPTGCTTCVRPGKPGEGKGATTSTKAPGTMGDPEESDGDDGDSGGGAGADGDDAADGAGDTPPESLDGDVEHSWGKAGAGEPGEEEGDGGEPLTDEDAELMKALTRDLEGKMQEEWNRELNPIAVSSSGEWAQRIFGDKKTSTRLMLEEPTIEDRQAVVKVAAALSNLALPAVAKVSKAVVVPPGRMRSREALRASAERAQGQMVSARPWKSTVRRHTNARPLVLGVATDTSGSMRWAEKAVASFAYVYANAGHRIGARTAAVTYGDHVHRIARPGEVMEKIVRKTANDSTEEFDRAMAALDGVLHLTTPSSAAKILLVISDGAYVKGDEADKAAMWLRAMDRAGTHIVWITEHDTRETSYDYWLDEIARKLPRMTVRAAFPKGKKRTPYGAIGPSNVFDMINGAALEAITKDVSA